MKYTDGKNIMVYAQRADGAPVGAALETVSKAAELAKANGEEVIAVVFGKDTDTKTVITAGASKVLVAGEEGLQAEEEAQILVKLAEKYQPKAVYMAGTPEGKMIAPAVSAVFESGCVTDVTGITADGVYTSLSYNGNVLNDMKMGENLPHVATVRSGSFAKKLDESRTGEVIAEDASADTVRTKVVETVKEIAETVNLEEAHRSSYPAEEEWAARRILPLWKSSRRSWEELWEPPDLQSRKAGYPEPTRSGSPARSSLRSSTSHVESPAPPSMYPA